MTEFVIHKNFIKRKNLCRFLISRIKNLILGLSIIMLESSYFYCCEIDRKT